MLLNLGPVGVLPKLGLSVNVVAPPPPPPPAGLTTSWLVEYVDMSGVRQRTTIANDGSTSITVRQYANMTFDGRASRSTSSGCSTAGGAAQLMGFGINYGEALGGTWATSGFSRDVDIGPPIFSRCYTVTGARTVTLYIRDPDGRESAVNMTVNVQPLGSVVDISSGGSWPTWASNTVYGLAAGGDYRSRGPIDTQGTTGIRIIKTGTGADPLVAEFRPDGRGTEQASVVTNRTKDCVLVNINYAQFQEGSVGSDYCGSYGGRCQHFGSGTISPLNYLWEEMVQAGNATGAANVRFSRGVFVVNGGPIDGSTALPNYALLGGSRSMNFAGTRFDRTTGNTGGNPLRTYMDSTVLRHMGVSSSTPTFGFLKGSLNPNVYSDTPTDPWPADDSFGDYTLSRSRFESFGRASMGAWGTGPSYFWVCDNVFGAPGTVEPTYMGGWNPQNDLAPDLGQPRRTDNCYESANIGGFERNRTTYNADANLTFSGRNLSYRSNTRANGTSHTVTINSNPNRTHPDFLGPYFNSPRPVHSALA